MKEESWIGWQIKCLKVNTYLALTLDQWYKVIGESQERVRIIDDQGKEGWFVKDRFVKMGRRLYSLDEVVATIKKEIGI